ncbi:MAG: hypothetical protein QXL94_02195 [Candidatus Parvarchaeum sp.]
MKVVMLRKDYYEVSDAKVLGITLEKVYISFCCDKATIKIVSDGIPNEIVDNFEIVITKFIETKMYSSVAVPSEKIQERAIENTFAEAE